MFWVFFFKYFLFFTVRNRSKQKFDLRVIWISLINIQAGLLARDDKNRIPSETGEALTHRNVPTRCFEMKVNESCCGQQCLSGRTRWTGGNVSWLMHEKNTVTSSFSHVSVPSFTDMLIQFSSISISWGHAHFYSTVAFRTLVANANPGW